jgi:hypothetical protein
MIRDAESGPAGRSVRRLRITGSAAVLLLWVLVSFAIYVSNLRVLTAGDSVPASLIPVTLILDGTVMMDRFAEEERQRFSGLPYWLVETPRGTASLFPIMTGVLATPFYALPVLRDAWRGDLTLAQWRDRAVGPYQKITAAILAALSVALFWSICRAMPLRLPLALCLTALYGFGSEMFAIGSQALWQHGPASLAMLGCIRAFQGMAARPRTAAVVLSLCAGLVVAIRPQDLALAAPVVIAAAIRWPRLVPRLMLPGAFLLAPVIFYNETTLGSALGGYGRQASGLAVANLARGLPGSLFSPARGLFVYFPAALVAIILILRYRPAWKDGLPAALGFGVVGLALINAAWWDWGGGYCFGPRFMTEAQGPILVLIGLSLSRLQAVPRAVAACLGAVLVYSVFVQAMGVYSEATYSWNQFPDPDEKKRLWDFVDNPIFRGVRANLGSG